MSMAHALEVRVPFLDYKLVEYVMGVKDEFKYPQTPKKLLVESVGELIPSSIVNRPKMGFTLPWEHWLKNELKQLSQEHIERLSQRSFFNADAVKQLWDLFITNDKSITWSRMWPLIVLENWMEDNGIE
jgi:asparagine synthase (glutamine-hydrolysing)